MPAGLVIAIPSGLIAAGVPVWGVRLANALAERSRCIAIVVHEPDGPYSAVPPAVHPRVQRFDIRNAPHIESCRGDLSPYLQTYRDAIDFVWQRTNSPVVLSPNLAGDCYGLAAALSLTFADRLRVIGVQHSDIEYEARYLAHYEPLLSRLFGVSGHIASALRSRIPTRAKDIEHLAYGVPVANAAPTREPLAGRPLRIAYAGRMDREQKRALALPLLSQELDRRGVRHTLTLVGDGPATNEIDALLLSAPNACRKPSATGDEVRALFASSDIMVLPSRYEGLSISMLEAMAVGCVPVVARVKSGASEAITSGVNGEFAEVQPEADEALVARPMADAIERVLRRGVSDMSLAAWKTARERFSHDHYATRFERVLDDIATLPARPWPADRPCAFTGEAAAASGIVPADAAFRMERVLLLLAGRRIAIHGSGRHTLALSSVLAASPAVIAAMVDDDANKHGTTLWGWPIVAPGDLKRLGITDVVVSSAMHEAAILRRSATYQREGIRVYGIYQVPPRTLAAA